MISTLMLVTLVAAALLGAGLWLHHMRKPENRHPMEGQRERNIAEMQEEAPRDPR